MNARIADAVLLLARAGTLFTRHLAGLPWEACGCRMLRLL